MRSTGTGAPAESSMEIRSKAIRCSWLSWLAVATTLRSAAGEANIKVVSPAMAAWARAVAGSVAGVVTDISVVTDVAPIAGPHRANGAKHASKPAPKEA